MKFKNVMTLAAISAAVGLAGFATTGCGLDVPGSLMSIDSTGGPGLDDGGDPITGGSGSIVPLEDSSLELEGPGR